MDGGLALLFYLDRTPYRSEKKKPKPATRGDRHQEEAEEVVEQVQSESFECSTLISDFEVYLATCIFCLRSEDKNGIVTTLPLKRINKTTRPDAKEVLPRVTDAWEKIMSRYSFELQNEEDNKQLREKPDWILYVEKAVDKYATHQVCLPQPWLPRLTDGWLKANSNADQSHDNCDLWYLEPKDNLGIPTAESMRGKLRSDPSTGRHHFKVVSVPNEKHTEYGRGSQAVDLSDKPLISPYST